MDDDCPFSFCELFDGVDRFADRIMCLAIFLAGFACGRWL